MRLSAPGDRVQVLVSTRADGDFHVEQPHDALDARRRALVDLPWTQLDEVHGTDVRVVTLPGEHDGAVGDGLVTELAGAVLGVWVGDCAPVVLVGDDGRIGAAHAGWKGLEAGVLQATVHAVRRLGATTVHAVLGPCIHPCCYEFGAADLDRLAARFGDGVRATTTTGSAALDLPAGVRAALAEVGVELDDRSECTGCAPDRWFSHRVRAEHERQMMAVWRSA